MNIEYSIWIYVIIIWCCNQRMFSSCYVDFESFDWLIRNPCINPLYYSQLVLQCSMSIFNSISCRISKVSNLTSLCTKNFISHLVWYSPFNILQEIRIFRANPFELYDWFDIYLICKRIYNILGIHFTFQNLTRFDHFSLFTLDFPGPYHILKSTFHISCYMIHTQ